ncbi:MAG: insulinase family protein [Candidatus Pelagadaptatus aseana]|uniref:insulinase family protein n=1 Tax=Candidatus Pelagadaptatus aseana TaxID=3120508 RepID=UPI0039B29533
MGNRPAICFLILLVWGLTGCDAELSSSKNKDESGELTQAAASGDVIPGVVIKGDSDPRTYRYLSLANDLRVVLISDPETQKAAASLDVAIGSADDPRDREGLAHFLEHMLFLGTEKYPEPDAYQSFISQQGGSHNAYTSPEHTNYFFDVKAEALPEALDRFSQFFTAPLFTPEYVDRERNAVHSEYRAKIKDSYRRERDVYREIASQSHPMSKFTVGSLTTLADRDGDLVRDDLLDFYQRYYSSDRMTLVVLGRESLDDLQTLVEPLFNSVPLRKADKRIEGQSLFDDDLLPVQLRVQSEKQEQLLSLMFPVSSARDYYRQKPLQYLGNLLGHEGEGSLFALLKQQGWVESLSAGGYASGRNQGVFEISMRLTADGYRNRDQVVAMTMAKIDHIRQSGIEAWRFAEQKMLADIAFRFAEKGKPIGAVSRLSRQMHDYPVTDYLRGAFLFAEFDKDLIASYLAQMTTDNLLLQLTSPDEVTDRQSSLYSTPYSVEPLPPLMEADDELLAQLSLPPVNPFVPEQLGLKPKPAGSFELPRQLESADGLALWHHQDQTFNVPKSRFAVRVKTPLIGDSPDNAALGHLYAALVNDQLNAFSYPALLAGLYFDFGANTRGFDISVGGYSDRQQVLLKEVLRVARQAEFSPERFQVLREELLKSWRNTRQLTPYRQLFRRINTTLYSPGWDDMSMADAVASASFEQLQNFASEVWAGSELTMFSSGNVTEEESLQMGELLQSALLLPSDNKPVAAKVVDLKVGQVPHYGFAVDHDDVAAALYLQADDDSIESRALSALLQQNLKSAFFHELRTQQQLGYIVFVTGLELKKVTGSLFVVQSPSTPLPDVVAAINHFLAEQLGDFDDFESHRQALLQKLREPPKNQMEQATRHWRQILGEDHEFDDRELMASYIESLSKERFVEQVRGVLAAPQSMWFSASRNQFVIEGTQAVQDVQVFKGEQEAFQYP